MPGDLDTLPERVATGFVAGTESAGRGEHAVVALIRSAASGEEVAVPLYAAVEREISLIEQVVQMTMLRVILPWMIGQAFERLSEPQFIALLGEEVKLPAPMSQDEMRQFL